MDDKKSSVWVIEKDFLFSYNNIKKKFKDD